MTGEANFDILKYHWSKFGNHLKYRQLSCLYSEIIQGPRGKNLGVKYCCLSDKLNDMNMRWKVEGGRWKVRPIISLGHINCEVDRTVFPAMTLLT